MLLSGEEHMLEGEHQHQAAARRKAAHELASFTFLTVLRIRPEHHTLASTNGILQCIRKV